MARILKHPTFYKHGGFRFYYIAFGTFSIAALGSSYMYFLWHFYYKNHISPGPLHPKQMEREWRQRGSKAHGLWAMNLGHTMNGVDHYDFTWLKHLEDDDIQNNYHQEYLNASTHNEGRYLRAPISAKDEAVIKAI